MYPAVETLVKEVQLFVGFIEHLLDYIPGNEVFPHSLRLRFALLLRQLCFFLEPGNLGIQLSRLPRRQRL